MAETGNDSTDREEIGACPLRLTSYVRYTTATSTWSYEIWRLTTPGAENE